MFLVFLPIFFCHLVFTNGYVITVYGDVQTDAKFFTETLPWIVDNIGGEIMIDFYMVGSGRYGVPQMCALEELKMNTFLQAQYLKCEAEGNPSEKCLCDSGIDPAEFKTCVATKGNLASVASAKFANLGVDATPVIELGYKSTIFGVDDEWYLKKICTIFGDRLPRGCVKPFDCNRQNDTVHCCNRKAIAHFDGLCNKQCWKECCEEPEMVTTTTMTPFETTSPYYPYPEE